MVARSEVVAVFIRRGACTREVVDFYNSSSGLGSATPCLLYNNSNRYNHVLRPNSVPVFDDVRFSIPRVGRRGAPGRD